MLNYLASDWQQLNPYWQQFLNDNCRHLLLKIDQQLTTIAGNETIFPPQGSIFKALTKLTPATIKVVILGQDPYHGEHEANGLAFAVNPGIKTPPSLKNIFKEIAVEFNQLPANFSNSLLYLDNQGVLLLNSSLTVIKDKPNSLAKIGWQPLTDLIIREISDTGQHCVFMLWGNYARSKKALIDSPKHLVLEAAHPSPLSATRGFFGCNHFQFANQFLQSHNLAPINWLTANQNLL